MLREEDLYDDKYELNDDDGSTPETDAGRSPLKNLLLHSDGSVPPGSVARDAIDESAIGATDVTGVVFFCNQILCTTFSVYFGY